MSKHINELPQWVFRFLQSFCPQHLYEEIEGDLLQRYALDVKKFNAKKAKRRLIWSALRFFRPGILVRNKISTTLNQRAMLKNYSIVMLRNLLKHKFYSATNALGLTLA